MMCDACKCAADWDAAEITGLMDSKPFVGVGSRGKHCEDSTCTCQHRPVGSVLFEGQDE